MANRFRFRFSRIFQTSFFSCRSKKHLSDIIEKAIPIPRKLRIFHLIDEESSRRTQKFRTPKTTISSNNGNEAPPRHKVSERFSPFLAPPVSPVKVAPPCEFRDCLFREKKKKRIKERKRKKNKKRTTATECGGAWWYSSGDDETEDETETLFSSRSLTSDSSVSRVRRRTRRSSQVGAPIPLQGKVKGSFPVVKKSTDPYKDFRASMVEMIVEKKIFGERELEELLECFLSLNYRHYHSVIFEVYAEVRDALFFSDLGFRN